MTETFLVCRPCGLISPLAVDLSAYDEVEGELSDLELFRYAHATHGLERATRLPTPAVYDRPVWDPMATAWFEITIDGEVFLVRSWRTSIEEPRCRQLIGGVIQRGQAAIELDELYLQRALDHHFHPHVLSDTTAQRVVTAVHALVATLDPTRVETTFDDADDPEIGVAPMPETLARALLEQSSAWFDPLEQERFARFVESNRSEDGALALRVRRPLIVVPG